MVRIIVAGGRDFDDYETLKNSVLRILSDLNKREIVLISRGSDDNHDKLIEWLSGTADGADTLGERFAEEYGYEVKRFPAKWMQDGKYNKYAGFERNKKMAIYASEEGNYGVLIAFWDGESKGTLNMIDNAIKYKMEIHVIKYKRG